MDTPSDNVEAQAPFWFCQPKYSLIASADPLSVLWIEAQIKQDSGLDQDDLDNQPLCAYPLPPLGDNARDQPLARKITNLKWFSHPIMWLKGDILRPHPFPVQEGDEPRDEFDSEIALRLALQLEVTGFYRSASGEWYDIAEDLGETPDVGLNVDDPFDQARIRAWQNGEPDEVFDNYDLGAIIKYNFPIHDAVGLVEDLLGPALIVSGVLGSFKLVEAINSVLDSRIEEEISAYTTLVSVLGASYAGPLMSDAQDDSWIARMGQIDALYKENPLIPVRAATMYLSEMRDTLNSIVADHQDVIDESLDVVQSLQDDIAKAHEIN